MVTVGPSAVISPVSTSSPSGATTTIRPGINRTGSENVNTTWSGISLRMVPLAGLVSSRLACAAAGAGARPSSRNSPTSAPVTTARAIRAGEVMAAMMPLQSYDGTGWFPTVAFPTCPSAGPARRVAVGGMSTPRRTVGGMTNIRLQPGDPAPDFTLTTDSGSSLSLADLRGRKVILYAYPAAMTPGCTTQACDFRDSLASLQAAGYEVVGLSPDTPEKLAKFRERDQLTFPLLS